MEVINKILDILKGLFPFVIGYLSAKSDTKIDNLEVENEKLKEYKKIDDKPIDVDVFDAGMWK